MKVEEGYSEGNPTILECFAAGIGDLQQNMGLTEGLKKPCLLFTLAQCPKKKKVISGF